MARVISNGTRTSIFGLYHRGPETLPMIPPQADSDRGKMTVVLDIDETLIHTSRRQKIVGDVGQTFQIKVFGEVLTVHKRPNMDQFLNLASTQFELISYTAGHEEYSQAILSHIDPTGNIFKHRLFRQHCAIVAEETLIKDLSIINRCPTRLVLVDNTIGNFLLQPENGIPVTTFVGGEDNALSVLWEFLLGIDLVKDVRVPLRATFKLPELFGTHLGHDPNSGCNEPTKPELSTILTSLTS
jgi:Dullard-like phosphatase family protein